VTNLPITTLTLPAPTKPPQINLRVEPQAPMDNWCWACVGAAIINHYNHPPAARILPCQVANRRFPGKKCCPQANAKANAPDTDVEGWILDAIRNPAPGPDHYAGVDDWGQRHVRKIASEINQGRPVCVQLKLSNTYHYVLIIGVHGADLESEFTIEDPMGARRTRDYISLSDAGAWYLFWTKP
jgi:Papain-like cysteine protease AvrRpt2